MIAEKLVCFDCGKEIETGKDFWMDKDNTVQLCDNCYYKNMDGRITEKSPYGQHVYLICTKCGAIFHTKNIAPLGCRTLFYGKALGHFRKCMDCDAQEHKLADLRLATKEEIDEAKRKLNEVDPEDEAKATAEFLRRKLGEQI